MKRISMRSLLVGIDPGSLYTRVVVADAQQEISEPSLAAVTTQGEVVAVGTEAAIRLRAEPRGLVAVRPFAGGVVAQQAAAQLLLQSILDKVQRGAVTRPTVCLAVPSLASQVAARAWLQTTRKAGVLETLLVDRGAATAIGTGWDPLRAEAVVAADCGAGFTLTALSGGGYLANDYLPAGGRALSAALRAYLRETYGVMVEPATIQTLVREVAVCVPSVGETQQECTGRLLADGTLTEFTVTSTELLPLVREVTNVWLQRFRRLVRGLSAQAQADLLENGVRLTGGSALLKGFDLALAETIGIPVQVAKEPFGTVARGSMLALNRRAEWPYLLVGGNVGRNE